MKRLLTIILCVGLAIVAFGAPKKGKRSKTHIKSWTLPAYTVVADTVNMGPDTTYLNLPIRNMLDDYSISNAWNGNLVSPVQSRLYFKRREDKIDDIFGRQYAPYIITPQDVRYFNTTVPYSRLGYQHGFTQYHEEHDLEFLFTGNFNKRANVGAMTNYLTAAGHYAHQEAKLFNGAVWGSYNGNHYNLHAAFTWNTLKNFENGGLQNVEDLKGPLEPEEMPVNLTAMSEYLYLSGFMQNSYSLTVTRTYNDTIRSRDSHGTLVERDTTIEVHIPVTTFAHTFEVSSSQRRYIEHDSTSYYPDTYRNAFHTNDTSQVLTIKNTVSVTFEEAFNKLLKFGAIVYARNEFQRFTVSQNQYFNPLQGTESLTYDQIIGSIGTRLGSDSLTYSQWTNNTFVGGSIYKKLGKNFRFVVNGDVCVVGYKIGKFDVNGRIDLSFKVGKDTLSISPLVQVRNDKPSFFLTNYYSNHYRWNWDPKSVFRFRAGGVVAYPTKWVKPAVDINFENITNYIYFDSFGRPQQVNGNVQIFSADIRCDLTTPWVNLENNVICQVASRELPVPAVVLYHNLYYHGTWFKALDTQIGVDMRYFTRYNGQILCPATGQFCVQDQVKIGNYPYLSVYANFYVRLLHLKFYVQYTHFNHLFMKQNIDYLAMPLYPMNPDIFRLGIMWHFYK